MSESEQAFDLFCFQVAVLLITSAVIGLLIGWRNACPLFGFIAGLFLGPLGVIAVLFNDKKRKCHACKTRILKEATVCRYCGKEQEQPIASVAQPKQKSKVPDYLR